MHRRQRNGLTGKPSRTALLECGPGRAVTALVLAAVLAHLSALPPSGEAAADESGRPADAGSEAVSTEVSGYRLPDQTLVDIIDARRTPWTTVGPNREWVLLRERPGYPSIEELAERELRLGGLRIKPDQNARSRTWHATGLTLLRVSDGESLPVAGLPGDPRIENAVWSPDASAVAFTNTTASGMELWIVDVGLATARRLTGPSVSLTANVAPVWLYGSESLVCCVVPSGRGPEPERPAAPGGPVIQETTGEAAPARTYQDLLGDPFDEALFGHYLTTQLSLVSLGGGVTPLGEPGMIWDVDPSPDGSVLLVSRLHRPFSYLVTASRFPTLVEVWDLDGNVVHEVADLPLRESVPIARGSVAEGPRAVVWRADSPATLCWAEALDGGDAAVEADVRDQVYLLEAPFAGDPVPWFTTEFRFSRVHWCHDDLAFAYEWWWPKRTHRYWKIEPGDPTVAPALLVDHMWEDRYSDPGEPAQILNGYGRGVLQTADDAHTVFMIGEGASPEGDRPFLDAFDTYHGETHRLFRSEGPYYETPVALLSKDARSVLTMRESVSDVPNFFLRDLADGSLRQLTSFPHPTPGLKGLEKELIRYERADGIGLTGTLYLPPGYEVSDGPLPMVMWAYPREFKDADAAGQVVDSPYRFDWIGWWSPLLWLTQGYSVLDGPTMPIVGEDEAEPNDTYLEQLVMSAEAAIDEVVRRGVADRDRIAIGGHSYGAFMTANLLAHSDLFAAGLARTGAYNRTLTPFGFQSEERTLWESPDVYFEMSPFMHADKIDEPLLIVHGDADSNPGTFPMQSERLYGAMKGLGGTARLVMLPHESHSYRARESLLHLLWETQEWLNRYVKNRELGDEASEASPGR
ncbi:MAG: prolyl oligopeptidase family serine peptidase [Candidatus Eisenbacteria bacterium]